MACEPNTLASDARCFTCLTPVQHMEVQAYLLAVLAGGSTDPNTLAREARCFRCLPPALLEQVKAYLLCQIATNGGSELAAPGVDDWTFTDVESEATGETVVIPASVEWDQYRWRVDDMGDWTESAVNTAGDPLPLVNLNDYLTTQLIYAQVRWVTEVGAPLSDWSASKTLPGLQEPLNSVTWEPDDILVDYDIGEGTVVGATMAEFNLVDPTLVISFALENQGMDTIINLEELVNLQELRLSGNDLTGLSIIVPTTLTLLDLSNNSIDTGAFPTLPSTLEQFFIANNNLPAWPISLPVSLTIFDVSGNLLGDSPNIADLTGSGIVINMANNDIIGPSGLPDGLAQLLMQGNDFSGGVSFAYTGSGDGSLLIVNVTDCNMSSSDSAALVEFIVNAPPAANGTLSMLGNGAPNGAEGAIETLIGAGWTVTFPQLTIPAPVAMANAPDQTSIPVEWTWAGREASIDEFEIRWGTAPGVYETGSDTVAPNVLSYNITGLDPETIYYIVVRAIAPGDIYYAAGNGPDSNEVEATTEPP